MLKILDKNGLNTYLRSDIIINCILMKIIIRYHSQWGNMSTKSCIVNPNIKVAQLKKQIA